MENTRVKKIVILVAALLTLTIVGSQFGLTNFMQAFAESSQDINVEYSAQVNKEKSEEQIQIHATSNVPEVEITSIELPNGQVVNDTTATYQATENGKLTFTIHYKLPKLSSEQPFIEKEPEYEEKQQITTYQVTGIQPITEQEEQTPTVSSPALIQPLPLTNNALQQNNLGDTPNAYTPESAFTFDTTTGTITQYNPSIGGTAVVIPPTIHGIPVKAIGKRAFYSKNLTGLTIAGADNGTSQLQSIEEYAFYSNKLTGGLTLPASLQTIGVYAFASNSLTGLTIAGADNGTSQLQSIEEYAFDSNKLAGGLTLPASLQTIGESAFFSNSLTGLTITGANNGTSQLQSIGAYAFFYNKLSEGLTLPASLKTIEVSAFSSNALTGLTITGADNGTSKLQSIGYGAFQNNKLSGDLTLPASLKTIEFSAFQGSYNGSGNQLTGLTIAGAIEGTSQLQSIGNSAFQGNKLSGDLTLPASLQTIGNSAFASYQPGQNQIISLTIPDSVTSLGNKLIDTNTLSGQGYHQIDNNKYKVDLKEQIPGFHPADYKLSPTSSSFSHVTDYSYDNQTGVFTFSSDDVTQAQFGLLALNIGNSTVQEGGGVEANRSIILFNGLLLPANYVVTLDLQGGHFVNPSPPDFTGHFEVAPGQKIDPSIAANMASDKVAYSKDGYRFEGWYTDTACTQPFDIINTPVTSNMTLYANYTWEAAIQNPSIMVAIPSAIKLTDHCTPDGLMAEASIKIDLVDADNPKFKPTKNVVINTQRHPTMERVNHNDTTPFYTLDVIKPDGHKYKDTDPALMTLNYFASSGNPNSAEYTVQTPIDNTKLLGDYTGNITYTITLE